MLQSSEQDAGAPREKEMAKFTRELAGRQSPLGKIKPLACAAPALKKTTASANDSSSGSWWYLFLAWIIGVSWPTRTEPQ